MYFQGIFLSIFLSAILGGINAQDNPPKISGSYRAFGEMVEIIDEPTSFELQIAFQESYDSESKDAVFRIWEIGKSITYTENYKTKQTFMYSEEDGCHEMTLTEWIDTESPPQLLNYEDSNGTVRFSLKQLFALDDKLLKERAVPSTFRGLPAKMWLYELNGTEPGSKESRVISVYSYWSDESWNTTSNEKSVPLGYVVNKMDYEKNKSGMKIHEQYINVFALVPDAVDRKLFEPIQGLVCPNRKQTIKFPDVTNIQALALHSEILFPDFQQMKYVDTWFDPQNKLMRVDMERINDEVPVAYEESRKYQSDMILGKLGIVYRLAYFKGALTCSIIPVKDYDLDIQNLINFKDDVNNWKVGNLFGLNQTSYVYIGKTTKRDIPCHLFQGKRTDWPEPDAKVESLWEWCFSSITNGTEKSSVIFKNGEYGLISAQIQILNTSHPADYPPNFRIFHHFYDVNSVDPKLMDATNFDISKCFEEKEKRRLQFTVDWAINADNLDEVENLTSDLTFLLKWKNALYRNTGLDPISLRITNVKSMVSGKNLLVKFTILAPHKDLPKNIKDKEITAFNAEKTLRDNISKQKLYISFTLDNGKEIPITVLQRSLKYQVNNTFIPHVEDTTTPSPISTTTTFVLNTDDDDWETDETSGDLSSTKRDRRSTTRKGSTTSGATSTTNTKKPTSILPTEQPLKDKKTLHKSGTVAAVSIALLLVGISIGSTGFFVKSNGLPQCLRFRRRG